MRGSPPSTHGSIGWTPPSRHGSGMDDQSESVGEKPDRIAAILDDKYRHQAKTLDALERRLRDLERAARR
jgi:hypothetical protein